MTVLQLFRSMIFKKIDLFIYFLVGFGSVRFLGRSAEAAAALAAANPPAAVSSAAAAAGRAAPEAVAGETR